MNDVILCEFELLQSDLGFVRDGLGCELYWLRAKREGFGLESSSWGSGEKRKRAMWGNRSSELEPREDDRCTYIDT